MADFRVDDAQKALAAMLLMSTPVGARRREVCDRDVVIYDEGMYGERHGPRFAFIMLAAMTVTLVLGPCIIG